MTEHNSATVGFEVYRPLLRKASWLLRNQIYLVVAVAILYSTIMGTTVQLSRLRQQVDIHYARGLSYLKIGLRWLRGTIYKSRELLQS